MATAALALVLLPLLSPSQLVPEREPEYVSIDIDGAGDVKPTKRK